MIVAGIDIGWLMRDAYLPQAMVLAESVMRAKSREAAMQARLMRLAIQASIDKKSGRALERVLKGLTGDGQADRTRNQADGELPRPDHDWPD